MDTSINTVLSVPNVNIENIRKLRTRIDQVESTQFDIGTWLIPNPNKNYESSESCKTVACFGGWTEVLMREEGVLGKLPPGETKSIVRLRVEADLAKWLGLNIEEANYLFYKFNIIADSGDFKTTVKHGIALCLLDIIIEEKRIDHEKAMLRYYFNLLNYHGVTKHLHGLDTARSHGLKAESFGFTYKSAMRRYSTGG